MTTSSQKVISRGSKFLLFTKVGENYKLFAGIKVLDFSLSRRFIDVSNKNSPGWKEIMVDDNSKQISIKAIGILIDQENSADLFSLINQDNFISLKIVSETKHSIEGNFFISLYKRGGAHDTEEYFEINMASSGKVVIKDK